MIQGLHALFSGGWQFHTTPPVWNGKGIWRDCNSYSAQCAILGPRSSLAARVQDHCRTQWPKYLVIHPRSLLSTTSWHFESWCNVPLSIVRGYLQPILVSGKHFNSVQRESMEPSGSQRYPQETNGLICCLYSEITSASKCGVVISDIFPVLTGVRQGYVISPTLFFLYKKKVGTKG